MVCIDEYFCCNAFQVLNIKNKSQVSILNLWVYSTINVLSTK